jgi:hypothetical protein
MLGANATNTIEPVGQEFQLPPGTFDAFIPFTGNPLQIEFRHDVIERSQN